MHSRLRCVPLALALSTALACAHVPDRPPPVVLQPALYQDFLAGVQLAGVPLDVGRPIDDFRQEVAGFCARLFEVDWMTTGLLGCPGDLERIDFAVHHRVVVVFPKWAPGETDEAQRLARLGLARGEPVGIAYTYGLISATDRPQYFLVHAPDAKGVGELRAVMRVSEPEWTLSSFVKPRFDRMVTEFTTHDLPGASSRLRLLQRFAPRMAEPLVGRYRTALEEFSKRRKQEIEQRWANASPAMRAMVLREAVVLARELAALALEGDGLDLEPAARLARQFGEDLKDPARNPNEPGVANELAARLADPDLIASLVRLAEPELNRRLDELIDAADDLSALGPRERATEDWQGAPLETQLAIYRSRVALQKTVLGQERVRLAEGLVPLHRALLEGLAAAAVAADAKGQRAKAAALRLIRARIQGPQGRADLAAAHAALEALAAELMPDTRAAPAEVRAALGSREALRQLGEWGAVRPGGLDPMSLASAGRAEAEWALTPVAFEGLKSTRGYKQEVYTYTSLVPLPGEKPMLDTRVAEMQLLRAEIGYMKSARGSGGCRIVRDSSPGYTTRGLKEAGTKNIHGTSGMGDYQTSSSVGSWGEAREVCSYSEGDIRSSEARLRGMQQQLGPWNSGGFAEQKQSGFLDMELQYWSGRAARSLTLASDGLRRQLGQEFDLDKLVRHRHPAAPAASIPARDDWFKDDAGAKAWVTATLDEELIPLVLPLLPEVREARLAKATLDPEELEWRRAFFGRPRDAKVSPALLAALSYEPPAPVEANVTALGSRILNVDYGPPKDPVFTHDGRRLVARTEQDKLVVYHVRSGELLKVFPIAPNVREMRLLPDDTLMIAWGAATKILDLETGLVRQEWVHPFDSYWVRVSDRGERVILQDRGRLVVWEPYRGATREFSISDVDRIGLSADGTRVAFASRTAFRVRALDTTTGEIVFDQTDRREKTAELGFSPEGRLLVIKTGGYDDGPRRMSIWDLTSKTKLYSGDEWEDVSFSADGLRYRVAGQVFLTPLGQALNASTDVAAPATLARPEDCVGWMLAESEDRRLVLCEHRGRATIVKVPRAPTAPKSEKGERVIAVFTGTAVKLDERSYRVASGARDGLRLGDDLQFGTVTALEWDSATVTLKPKVKELPPGQLGIVD